MAAEHAAYDRIMGRPPTASRQHYLRMVPSETRRQLLRLGVLEDHTEGHAVRTGWRGGFARPRRWYDLDREALTDLVLHPFAAMDATYLRYLLADAQEVPHRVADLAREAVRSGVSIPVAMAQRKPVRGRPVGALGQGCTPCGARTPHAVERPLDGRRHGRLGILDGGTACSRLDGPWPSSNSWSPRPRRWPPV